MNDSLLPLLVRLASGDLSPALIAEIRAGLAAEPLAAELDAATLFADDPVGDARALLDALGPPGTLVGEALAREAGESSPLGELFAPGLPIAAAVRAAAGPVDVRSEVMVAVGLPLDGGLPDGWMSALLDSALPTAQHLVAAERVGADPALRTMLRRMADVGREVREGVTREAGTPRPMWPAVSAQIGVEDAEAVSGWDEALLREAVVARAGTVDVAGRVMDAVRRDARAPELILDEAPANDLRWPVLLTLALAAAAVLVFVPRLLEVTAPPVVASTPDFVAKPIAFAAADEINVDRIQYGGNTSVFIQPPENGDGPLILWIDDGANL